MKQALEVSPKLTASKAPKVPEEMSLEVPQKASFAVIGSGCYRIGASVEFDWSCISALRTLRETGHRAMVINCNPETVSTDYDESDRLYFAEHAIPILGTPARSIDMAEDRSKFSALCDQLG